MFFLYTSFIITVIYFFSALIGESFFNSIQERRLHPLIRMGLGYLVMLTWFGTTMKIMPVHLSWLIGLIILSYFIYFHLYRYPGKWLIRLIGNLKLYSYYYVFFFFLTNLFFLPLHIAGIYGPFTEAGGDITMYADVAKYLTDHRLPAYGIKDIIYDLSRPTLSLTENSENFKYYNPQLGNPPQADYQYYKVVLFQRYCSFQFSPCAQWYFLCGQTNYPAFYANLGFLYACILAYGWLFMRPFGIFPAFLGSFMLFSSHGLVSVFYNMYFLQSICLMITALLLNIFPFIRFSSLAGFRLVFFTFSFILASYTHFIAALLPFIILFGYRFLTCIKIYINNVKITFRGIRVKKYFIFNDFRKQIFKLLYFVFVISAMTMMLFGVAFDTTLNIPFYVPTIQNAYAHLLFLWKGSPISLTNSAMTDFSGFGKPIYFFSSQNISFIIGFLSQQHFPPNVLENRIITGLVYYIIFIANILIIFMFLCWFFIFRNLILFASTKDYFKKYIYWYFIFIFLSFCTIIGHYLITQSSLYLQAKGAQNVLILLYIVLILLPFGILYRQSSSSWISKIYTYIFSLCLLFFCFYLLSARLWFTGRLSYQMDRSSILEQSFYNEAKKIISSDANPFVIFEPKNSSDIYMSVQPFFKKRMIPTRHLILQTVDIEYMRNNENNQYQITVKRLLSGKELINANDINHLWYISARKIQTKISYFFGNYFLYEWNAHRLVESNHPELLLLSDSYEPFSKVTSYNNNIYYYSYMRNGSALLFLPPNQTNNHIDVTLTKVLENDKIISIPQYFLKNLLFSNNRSDGIISLENGFLSLRYDVSSSYAPQFISLFDADKEYWINVRVNNMEVDFQKPQPDVPPIQLQNEKPIEDKYYSASLHGVDRIWDILRIRLHAYNPQNKYDLVGYWVGPDGPANMTFDTQYPNTIHLHMEKQRNDLSDMIYQGLIEYKDNTTRIIKSDKQLNLDLHTKPIPSTKLLVNKNLLDLKVFNFVERATHDNISTFSISIPEIHQTSSIATLSIAAYDPIKGLPVYGWIWPNHTGNIVPIVDKGDGIQFSMTSPHLNPTLLFLNGKIIFRDGTIRLLKYDNSLIFFINSNKDNQLKTELNENSLTLPLRVREFKPSPIDSSTGSISAEISEIPSSSSIKTIQIHAFDPQTYEYQGGWSGPQEPATLKIMPGASQDKVTIHLPVSLSDMPNYMYRGYIYLQDGTILNVVNETSQSG